MVAAEILERHEIAGRAVGRTQPPLQDFLSVGSGDSVHGVEAHTETRLEQGAQRVEVEQALHQLGIIGHGVDDFDLDAANFEGAQLVEIDRIDIGDLVGRDHLAAGIDRIRQLLGRWAAIFGIVLDAEILMRAAGIVACRQDEATESLALADQVGGGGRRQDAALPHHHATEAVGDRHGDHLLDHLAIVEAAVAADDQRLASETLERIEHRLNEVLDIVRLLEDGHLLAQARRARLLVVVGCGGDGANHSGIPF